MYKSVGVVCLCILVWCMTKEAQAQDRKSPASDFNRHTIVKPTVHHARTKREISSTKNEFGAHHPELMMKVDVEGEEYVLDLRLNKDLVPDGHVVSTFRDGKRIVYKPEKEEEELCQYTGVVRGRPNSRVAVSTCDGVRGIIYDGRRMMYIEPVVKDETIQKEHYIYDHSDLNSEYHCGYKGGATNNTDYDPLLLKNHIHEKDMKSVRGNRYKRSTETTEVRGPYNSNRLSRYVELVLVADHGEFLANGGDETTVRRQMKDVANIINSVYAPLNIFIALVGIEIWTESDRIPLLEDGDQTLTHFLKYRKDDLIVRIPNDNAQLLTRQKFKDGVVGKALKGPICTSALSGGVSTNHSEVIGLVATTVAHEMGHNFGMEHDDAEGECKCPDEKCIMSPSSTSLVPVHWSSCSLKSLALAFERGMDYCLRNKPKRLANSPSCGNGFVEAGEECDCGTELNRGRCQYCCHPDTCLLRRNATCATGECCDFETCRPKSAGTVCRPAEASCDLPEFCTGRSEYCPSDVYKMDATPCGNHKAYCVKGSCRSHTDQCRLLWGTTGANSDVKCYTNNNVKKDKNGNCGYDRLRNVPLACAPADALCGLLQCRHLNEVLEFGMQSVATLAAVFINNNGTIIPCRTAIIDLGLSDPDPGMVPDGAQCGDNKMCLNQKCVNVASVREAFAAGKESFCPNDCGGHGVCNSEGNCHCEDGFAPPDCTLPGFGGSLDSGPATDPGVQRKFMVAMYIIFLGIIPSIILALLLFYYSRHNALSWWKKPRKPSQSPKKASLPRRLSLSATKFAANFQNNSPHNPPPVCVPISPDDMSSSLLRNEDRNSPGNTNPPVNFFGNFKGFSLTPIEKNQTENEDIAVISKDKPKVEKSAKITPVHRTGSNAQIVNQNLKPVLRTAPPLPVVPATVKASDKSSPTVKRANSTVQDRIKALMNTEKTENIPPVVTNPPVRPVISSPILEASTCTAKELISPLQGSKTLGPSRAAPTIPTSPDLPKRPLSMHSASNVPQKPLPEEPKKVKEGISLNRIASFLKHDKPKDKERTPVERSNSLPKNPNHILRQKAVDKVALRNLQISNPILQKDIELPVGTVPVVSDSEDGDDSKAFVNRAQSMRAPTSIKPAIQSFGSMRQAPGVPRPVSVVGRPTAPPPPLPNPGKELPLYQNPTQHDIKQTDYVDCIEEKQAPLAHIDEESSDNIYAIIEESPVKHSKPLPGVSQPIKTTPHPPPEGYTTPKPISSNSGSTESVGLLGEIVNEIQNRNMDSIYSSLVNEMQASTLKRKKDKDSDKRDSTYMNTDHYNSGSVYSNSGAKSTASTTSSGYLHPSAVNVPTYLNKDKEQKPEEKPPSPNNNKNTKIPTFTRQVTPPGLKTTTFKSVPQSPKNTQKNLTASKISNSPDVVSSCAVVEIKNAKPPDVVNNNTKVNDSSKAKPVVTPKPNENRPPLRPAPSADKKVSPKPSLKPVNSLTNLNKPQIEKNTALNRVSSKVDSNVKVIADSLNKNKPKVVPKPAVIAKTDSNAKPNSTKLTSKPSNVASLQQKFENRKSIGKDITTGKK